MLEFDADFYDSQANVQFRLGMKTIKELNIQDGETILDIGCGTGRLTIEIAKKNLSGIIIGLDNNPDMIAKAKENIKRSDITNIQLVTKGILDYEPKIQFHAIFSNSALHWIQKTRDLYQKIFTILAPGGRLVAQIPTIGGYSHLVSYFIEPLQRLNLSIYFKNWTYPIKLIRPKTLQTILSSIGYEDIKVWVENQEIEFKTPEDLCNFLRTAALVPILTQIPPKKQESYLNHLLNEFKTTKKLNLHITMQRLFLKVKKRI